MVARPGVFMYHCGTSPVLQHIGMGMYGAIIVDPAAGRPPANETVLVQSEFYGKVKKVRIRPSYKAMQTRPPATSPPSTAAPSSTATGRSRSLPASRSGSTWPPPGRR